MTVKHLYKFILIATVFIFGTSSAEINTKELEQRAKARWDTIINYNFGETYNYETPNYRAVFTKDLYIGQFSHGMAWNLTKIEDIKYDRTTNVATVVLLVETKPRNSKGLDATVKTASVEIREKWLHIKGRWWHSSSE